VPVAALLRPLLDTLTTDPGGAGSLAWEATDPGHDLRSSQTGSDPGSEPPGLDLAPVCCPPLPGDRSLEACGVGHGAVLVLLNRPAVASPRGN
jgi:hypothetical protein